MQTFSATSIISGCVKVSVMTIAITLGGLSAPGDALAEGFRVALHLGAEAVGVRQRSRRHAFLQRQQRWQIAQRTRCIYDAHVSVLPFNAANIAATIPPIKHLVSSSA